MNRAEFKRQISSRLFPRRTLVQLLFFSVLPLSWSSAAGDDAEVSALQAGDYRYLADQRAQVNDLARLYLGRRFDGNKQRDLSTLQALLDAEVIKSGQTQALQAMGVILGDLMAAEHRLKWVVYRDDLGRSRALQLDDKPVFLFPITMISRRVDAGLKVDVRRVYDKAIAEIQEHLANRYRPTSPLD